VRDVVLVAAVSVAVALAVRLLVAQAYVIPSASMEPLLEPGDRVVVSGVDYWTGPVHRGDVIVFDGEGLFDKSEGDFVKRVIGLPGERVSCCDDQGRITVDDVPLTEPYLFGDDVPSEMRFDVEVPAGRLWLMGDHRSDSADSRAHLGDPGGGMVPVDRVVGRVVAVAWPPGRAAGVGRVNDGHSTARQEGVGAWAW